MQVMGIDERKLRREGTGVNFVVFIYEGGDDPNKPSSVDGSRSWSVNSYLLTDADFTEVLAWLGENPPREACYSVGGAPLGGPRRAQRLTWSGCSALIYSTLSREPTAALMSLEGALLSAPGNELGAGPCLRFAPCTRSHRVHG